MCNVRPQKEEVFRTRLTVNGSRIKIDMDCGTPTASLLTVKMLLNSVISTRGAKFMTIDIKDFYLNTPMERPEYLRMKIANFPDNVIEHYKLKNKVYAKGNLYVKCAKGTHELPHAGIITQKLLEQRLNKASYFQSDKTPGFWKHKWRLVSFSLIVDDFGVKYMSSEHAKHLIKVLKEHYTITEDWEAEKYSGITLDWDYHQCQVHLSMPDYCKEGLVRFQHKLRKLNHQPHSMSSQNMEQKYNTLAERTPLQRWMMKRKVHPASNRHFSVLRAGGRSNSASSPECHSSGPVKPH